MKILIVDDHEYNRELLGYILIDEGHECIHAVNGVEACNACLQDNTIDLILMDVSMPEMDGIEATTNIKRDHSDQFIPIIFITALDDADVLAQCLDAGGDDFVPKPINENVLLAKINAHGRTRGLYLSLIQANKQLEYHKQVMDREHVIVERIFDRGAERIKTACHNIAHYSSPMSMFNGDITLEAPSPSGGVYCLVGDFTGHGLAASIGTLPVTEIFYRLSAQQTSVGLLAKEINKSLVELLPQNMFFCAAICYINSEGRAMSMWVGGMNDLLCLHQADKTITHIPSEHMPLGILEAEEFDDTPQLIELNVDDCLYVYTDGVNEATNSEGDEFGVEGIKKVLAAGGTNVLAELINTVHHFQSGARNDDISAIEIRAGELSHYEKDTGEKVNIKAQFHRADSFPWCFNMRLENEELSNTNIVDQIMTFVGGIHGIELHQEKIFTIVSELYSNALEHGVLGLSSSLKDTADGFEEYYRLRAERLADLSNQFIDLEFSFHKSDINYVELSLTDSGKGFDYSGVIDTLDENADSHGRGLPLLNSLCAKLEYSNHGKTVKAIYSLGL
ncbi:MAG: fused response regulator/phosphatase [Agarilytica sp.]